jgi:N-acyl-L-homoserine lactone synthetase
MKKANKEYLTKVAQLTEEDRERLFSRMRGKLTRRIEDSKLNLDEAVAIQLELEDEQLQEWRENRVKINQKYKNI